MRRQRTVAGLIAMTAASVCFAASTVHSPGSPQYRIKLSSYVVPPIGTVGVLVQVRVNSGPPLRLLLDSGTQYLVLSRKAAIQSSCSGYGDINLIGVGASAASVVRTQLAETVQLGDLVLRDVPLLIDNRPLGDGIQGVLPLSVFSSFRIRLDLPAKFLDLVPYTSSPPDSAEELKIISSNKLFFVQGVVNERLPGYFLIDTGASYTALSRPMAHQLSLSHLLAERVPLAGGTTDLDAPLLRGGVQFRLGSREFTLPSVVAVDLSTASRYHGLEVAGLLGYPALCTSVLIVNYRENSVRIER